MVIVVQKEDPVLRKKAEEVPISDVKSPKIKAILANMSKALQEQEDGVAIAAPQIGESLRIFVIAGRVWNILKKDPKTKFPDQVYINPKILKRSKDKKNMEEGCLSVRWLYGKIKRSSRVSIGAYDENGNYFERGASGLFAQIFQHETDHLNGVLFIDTAKELKEVLPENQQKSDAK